MSGPYPSIDEPLPFEGNWEHEGWLYLSIPTIPEFLAVHPGWTTLIPSRTKALRRGDLAGWHVIAWWPATYGDEQDLHMLLREHLYATTNGKREIYHPTPRVVRVLISSIDEAKSEIKYGKGWSHDYVLDRLGQLQDDWQHRMATGDVP